MAQRDDIYADIVVDSIPAGLINNIKASIIFELRYIYARCHGYTDGTELGGGGTPSRLLKRVWMFIQHIERDLSNFVSHPVEDVDSSLDNSPDDETEQDDQVDGDEPMNLGYPTDEEDSMDVD